MAQRVLVIDDSPPIHALVTVRLREERVELFSAYDGESGLAMVQSLQPDLVLLDVDMPHPDGFEVCRRLKADPATMQIPVIFLTGVSSSEQKILGLDLGAVDYVTKPFDPAELRARVRASLRTKYLLDLLSRKAQIDGLTGLWNRTHFDQRLEAEISLARRSHHALSCLLVDIDHFKQVNDRYGHQFGDSTLRSVAQTLGSECRIEDIVCRYGGEEFAIVAPNTAAAPAGWLAERLRQLVAGQELFCRGTSVLITCSFGVAQFDGSSSLSLVEMADKALYQAKKLGRNRVEVIIAPTPPAEGTAADPVTGNSGADDRSHPIPPVAQSA